MAKLHVKITNLENGEVVVDRDAACFIGAMPDVSADGAEGIRGITSAEVDALTVARVILMVQGVIDNLLKDKDICAAKKFVEFMQNDEDDHGDEE